MIMEILNMKVVLKLLIMKEMEENIIILATLSMKVILKMVNMKEKENFMMKREIFNF